MPENKRPLSPHLTIYKPQLTSVLSISHRITGVVLSLGIFLFSFFLFAVAAGPEIHRIMVVALQSVLGQLLVILWIFSFFYHLCNGVRHLFWDVGKGLSIRVAYCSGYAVLLASGALTAATCLWISRV